MAAVMLTGTLAGCSAKSETSGTEAAKGEAGASQAQTEETLEGSLVSKEPKEFTVFLNFNNMPFDSNWQVWQEAAKRTNVSLKAVSYTHLAVYKRQYWNFLRIPCRP